VMARALAILLLGGACCYAAPRRYRQFNVESSYEAPRSYRQFDDDSYERSPYYADCPDGYVLRYDGECVETKVHKRFFIYKSPRDERRDPAIAVLQNPNRNYNYVFVKTPDVKVKDSLVIAPPKEQTLIYLLAQNQKIQRQVIELEDGNEKPELYHVNYSDENENVELPGGIDLQTALSHSRGQQSYNSERKGSYEGDFFTNENVFQPSYQFLSSREGRGNDFNVLNLNSYGGNVHRDDTYNDGNNRESDNDLRGDTAIDEGIEQEPEQGFGLENEGGNGFGAEKEAGFGEETIGGGTGQEINGGFEPEAQVGEGIQNGEGQIGQGSGVQAEAGQELEQEAGLGIQDQTGHAIETDFGGVPSGLEGGSGFESSPQTDVAPDFGGDTGFHSDVGVKSDSGINTARNLDPSPGLASTISVGLDGAPSAAFESAGEVQTIADQLDASGKSITTSGSGSGTNQIRLEQFEKVPKANLINFGDKISTNFPAESELSDVQAVGVAENIAVSVAEEPKEKDVVSDFLSTGSTQKISEPEEVLNAFDENAVSSPIDSTVLNVDQPEETVDTLDEINTVSQKDETVFIVDQLEETVDTLDKTDTVSQKDDIVLIVGQPEEVVDTVDEISIVSPVEDFILNIETVSTTDDTLLLGNIDPAEVSSKSLDSLFVAANETEAQVEVLEQDVESADGISLFVLEEVTTTKEASTSESKSTDLIDEAVEIVDSVDINLNVAKELASVVQSTDLSSESFTTTASINIPELDSATSEAASPVTNLLVEAENLEKSLVGNILGKTDEPVEFISTTESADQPTSFNIFNSAPNRSLTSDADELVPNKEERQAQIRKRFTRFFS